jgi:hypothetical protein
MLRKSGGERAKMLVGRQVVLRLAAGHDGGSDARQSDERRTVATELVYQVIAHTTSCPLSLKSIRSIAVVNLNEFPAKRARSPTF